MREAMGLRPCKIAIMAAVLGALTLATGCSSSKTDEIACALIEPVPDADLVPQFKPGPGREVGDVLVGGRITSVKGSCRREAKGIAVDLIVALYATRANLQIKSAKLPYFVAVTDIQHHVLAQEAFTLDSNFFPGENFRNFEEKITAHIPLKSVSAGNQYAVVVGFQLTPEQIAFNRAHRPQ